MITNHLSNSDLYPADFIINGDSLALLFKFNPESSVILDCKYKTTLEAPLQRLEKFSNNLCGKDLKLVTRKSLEQDLIGLSKPLIDAIILGVMEYQSKQ